MRGKILKLRSDNDNETLPDPVASLVYLILSEVPMNEVSDWIEQAATGKVRFQNDDTYSYAKLLAGKISRAR